MMRESWAEFSLRLNGNFRIHKGPEVFRRLHLRLFTAGPFGATAIQKNKILRPHSAAPGLRPPKVAYAPELQRRSGSCPQAGEGVAKNLAPKTQKTRSHDLAMQAASRLARHSIR